MPRVGTCLFGRKSRHFWTGSRSAHSQLLNRSTFSLPVVSVMKDPHKLPVRSRRRPSSRPSLSMDRLLGIKVLFLSLSMSSADSSRLATSRMRSHGATAVSDAQNEWQKVLANHARGSEAQEESVEPGTSQASRITSLISALPYFLMFHLM